MNKDNWNIFDLPQETDGFDWAGWGFVSLLIAGMVLIIRAL